MGGTSEKARAKLWLVPPPEKPARMPADDRKRRDVATRDDAELVMAVLRGDATAATAFHDRVRPQVDMSLRRLLGVGDVDHDDVAQLALIELVFTLDRFRGECSLDAWVSTITAHVTYNQIRRRRTERRIFTGLALEHLDVESRSRGGPAARSVLERIGTHLAAMDESRAWTFVLHDVCGHDLREISQITGVSVAAAQSRLVRGRRELHERIALDPELAEALDFAGEP